MVYLKQIKPPPCWFLPLWNNLLPGVVNSDPGKLEPSFVSLTKKMSKWLLIRGSKNSFVSEWVNIKMVKEKVLNILFTYLQFYYPDYFGPYVSFPNLKYLWI